MPIAPRLAFVALLLAARAAHAQWGPETPITSTTSDVWGEGIATSGATVHLIYGTNELRYRSSPDHGTTWTAERRLTDGVLHLTDPLVADGDDVWAIYLKDMQTRTDWCCARDLGNIYLLHSADGGQTWAPPKQLTTAHGAFRVSLAYDAGKLHVVWMDYRNSAWDTYYLRSLDRGATWEPERRIAISAGSFGAERPQIAAHGDGVHVTIWDDRGSNPACTAGPNSFAVCPDAYYIGSLDGGATWGAEINIANSGAAFSGRNDIAAAGASSVVINFNRSAPNDGDANPHVFAVRSPDNGATWEAPVQLTDTPGEADHGSIIGEGANVHLAWHDSRDGHLAIWYAHSADAGHTWEAPERASLGTAADSSTPLVAATPGYVHLLWLDHRSGTYQIYYRNRTVPVATGTDAGATAAPDAATGGDAGTDPSTGAGGCGCRTTGGPGALLPALLLALLLRRSGRR